MAYCAATFSGGRDFFDCGPCPVATFTQLTVEAWLLLPRDLQKLSGHVVNCGGGWDANGFSLFLYENNLRVELQRPGRKTALDNAWEAPRGRWAHVAMTWNGSAVRAYVNGVQCPKAELFDGTLPARAQRLNVGRNESQGYYLRGSVRDVRVWTVARTREQLCKYAVHLPDSAADSTLVVRVLLSGPPTKPVDFEPERLLSAAEPEPGVAVAVADSLQRSGATGSRVIAGHFEGSNYVAAGPCPLAACTALTVEAWIKLANVPAYAGNAGYTVVSCAGAADESGFSLLLYNNCFRVELQQRPCRAAVVDNAEIPRVKWTHVALVWSAATQAVRAYVDGALQPSEGALAAPQLALRDADLRIGAHARQGLPFCGLVRDVRLWDVARSAEELRACMYVLGPWATATARPLARYLHEEGSVPADARVQVVAGPQVPREAREELELAQQRARKAAEEQQAQARRDIEEKQREIERTRRELEERQRELERREAEEKERVRGGGGGAAVPATARRNAAAKSVHCAVEYRGSKVRLDVTAADVDETAEAICRRVGATGATHVVEVFDEELEDWFLLDSLEMLAPKSRVRVRRREDAPEGPRGPKAAPKAVAAAVPPPTSQQQQLQQQRPLSGGGGGSGRGTTNRRLCAPVEEQLGLRDYLRFPKGYSPANSCEDELRANALALELVDIDVMLRAIKDFIEDLKFADPPEMKILDANELFAIVTYTYDLGYARPEENLYYKLNLDLRQRMKGKMEAWWGYLYYLMKGLEKLPDVPETLYRGVPQDRAQVVEKEYAQGRRVRWTAFSSTTVDLGVAVRIFAGPGGVVFRIQCTSGRNLASLSYIRGEGEILLSPNITFRVKRPVHSEDGILFIDLSEEPPEVLVF
eukprot:m51a1_g986 putative laminin g sub domain 2 (876) ;mRNA; f:465018-468422